MKNIKLITLSIVKGQINLIATIPQRSTVIHLGAFLSINLNRNTARTIQLADMLMFTMLRRPCVI